MVIAVCSFAARARRREPDGRHRHRLGGADPAARARRRRSSRRPACRGAAREPLPEPVSRGVRRAGRARPRRPIDDVRGSAAYRRHALAVLARRTLGWAWQDSGEVVVMRVNVEVNGEQRTRRRRVAGREPAVRAARAARPARRQERLRAGRMRLLHGLPGRHAGVRVPGRGRAGRGPDRAHGRGARDRGRAGPGAGRVRPDRRGPVRLLHAGPGGRGARPACTACRTRATRRSARRWRATCAAAPGTRRSWTPSGSRRGPCGGRHEDHHRERGDRDRRRTRGRGHRVPVRARRRRPTA